MELYIGRSMKKIIIGLFMLFAVVCFASQASWAGIFECPDSPIACNYAAIGYQNNCWTNLKNGCQPCYNRRCPKLITSYKKLHHQANSSCLSKIIKSGRVDGCSLPKDINVMYNNIFKAACDEHDICYHTDDGKIICDINFHSNMYQICESYYTGLLNRIQKEVCKRVADTFYMGVHLTKDSDKADQNWKNKNCTSNKINTKKKNKKKKK